MAIFKDQDITVRNGHARTFSSELIHILLLKIQKGINISKNS
jgi:hypothetical protein